MMQLIWAYFSKHTNSLQLNYQKTTTKKKSKKWAEDLDTSPKGDIYGQQAHEETFNNTNYQRNANQKYNAVPPDTGQNGHNQEVHEQ